MLQLVVSANLKGGCEMQRFKKYQGSICSLILCAVYFMCPQTSFANPPQDMKLLYDSKSQMLAVTVTHKSATPNLHYIKSVEIKKNGNMVSDNKYESQSDQTPFTYNYKTPATAGETFEVTARCSLFGSKTVNLTVEK